ncbi:MAG: IucA/IucC family protein [Nocardiopsaceae bacterium]|nr:IucA/IucC family protein [Nocardiopsaceae bacterium]
MTPDSLTAQSLLNCLIREVADPVRPAREDGGRYLLLRLPRSGIRLRASLARASAGLAPRLDGTVEERCEGRWRPLDWRRLATLTARELTLASGSANPEFAPQVADSHAAATAILAAAAKDQPASEDRIHRYLASEQALAAGHRFHPAPKAGRGDPRDWLRYAPEAGARFPLRFLAVRDDLAADAGDVTALDRLGAPAAPPGYRTLPAHPWQLRLLRESRWLAEALRAGLVADLGAGEREVAPTSSVRTVYDPAADVFCKFSLQVRLTNCVRVSAWYELAGSVELTRLLAPALDDLAARHPGMAVLTEPGYRTVAAADKRCYQGLAVIVRDGLAARLAPGVTPLLTAALAEPVTRPSEDLWPPAPVFAWWEAYLRLVVPPVLDLLVTHGVALEPHMQNVIVGVDRAGLPAQVFFRDLEGVKLVRETHVRSLAAMPPGVARGLAYDAGRAWDRVLYCLLVNHLDQIAAALADRCPDPLRAEAELWEMLSETLAKCAADLGGPPRLRALLDGAPLPAKANLTLRWNRAADRESEYLPLPTPWSPPLPVPWRHE